ncbi:Pyruvate dehydrogenase E1 component subunit beta, mitochondrial [Hordeum vulgare]|nr:Pyruvate dehydrogenase E1 component subunit beta, mitochondrial [Hordeum vulgare]
MDWQTSLQVYHLSGVCLIVPWIEREGKDVTITAFSKMVGYALQVRHAIVGCHIEILSKEGISAEVINLRSIRPLDRDAINASVRKTNRLVTLEEGFPQDGVGAEICMSVVEESFEYLDAPIERIAGADVPMPYAANVERLAVPQIFGRTGHLLGIFLVQLSYGLGY